MRWWVLVMVCAIGCGDNLPPPIDVSAGRLIARIDPEPARITLLLDGKPVWSTRGDDAAPHGFAAFAPLASDVEMQFGAFRFTDHEDELAWTAIDQLADIAPTETGATFTLLAGSTPVGTGELTFVTATRSGPDPEAAGFPRHVRIRLATATGQRVSLATSLEADEHLVGLGGQSFDVDHRGETVPLWVQEDGIGKFPDPDDVYAGVWFFTGRKHSTHTPMPMVVSSRGYALAVDTDARAIFELGSVRADVARFEAWDPTLDLQVFIGEGPRDQAIAGDAAIDAFGHMIAWTGKPPRPPLAVFAPWIDAVFGSANVRRVADALRANGIAASAIWTEDWRGGADGPSAYVLEEDWHVDRAVYPDFEQLGTDLRGAGFAFLTYNNTFVDASADVFAEATTAGYSIHDGTGAPYSFTGVKFNPTTMLDLTNPAAVAWAKGVMGEGVTLGADGWMADYAEWLPADATLASGESALAVHNRYPVEWARFNAELFATPLPGRPPPLWFMRAAWLHAQPHAQVVWGGDQQTDFSDGDGLPSVIPIGIGLGLAGFPYYGSDVAGYMSEGTTPTTQELFYRWVSLGAFTPVMRTHHGRSARENVQWDHDAGTIAQFRRWSRFHMQLVPYQWGSIGSYERDGLPLMRLVALEYPGEAWAWSSIDEYLLGDRILVAPVQAQGASARQVTLPAGTWYPLFGGAAVTGEITASAGMAEIPVFAPAGALLVLYPEGVDTVLDAPASPGAVTAAEVGFDREVWLYPGTAQAAAHAAWHDELGAAGPPQWTWSGRTDGPLPSTATFNGAPVVVAGGVASVTGDGTLVFGDGSSLTITRGHPAANVTVRLR